MPHDMPEILFDGAAVFQALTPLAKRRTSPDNVSDVLDAVVHLLRAQVAAVTPNTLDGNEMVLVSRFTLACAARALEIKATAPHIIKKLQEASLADPVSADWNARAEGNADHQREGVLRMYVVAFCALIEGLADAADIDLAETEMTMEANGKQLAARSVEQMIADAKKLTGAHAALKISTGEGN